MAHLSPSVFIEGGILYAGVVKLADTLDLGRVTSLEVIGNDQLAVLSQKHKD